MEIQDTYGLFEVDGDDVRLRDNNESLEDLCDKAKPGIILNLEDYEKIVKVELFNDATYVEEQPYLNTKLKTEYGEITLWDLLKRLGKDVKKQLSYNLEFGKFTIDELIKEFNAKMEHTGDNSKIIINIPIYRLESDFILKKHEDLCKYLGYSEDDAILLNEIKMCKNLTKSLHQQNIDCKPITITLNDMKDMIIPTILINNNNKERYLTPAFLRPKSGFKYTTPSFYKQGLLQPCIIEDELEIISKIGNSLTSYLHHLKTNSKSSEKSIEDVSSFGAFDNIGDIYKVDCATSLNLECLFYKLMKDKLTIN